MSFLNYDPPPPLGKSINPDLTRAVALVFPTTTGERMWNGFEARLFLSDGFRCSGNMVDVNILTEKSPNH